MLFLGRKVVILDASLCGGATDDDQTNQYTMLLKNVHAILFNGSMGVLVVSNSLNVLLHDKIEHAYWFISFINLALLMVSFVPTTTPKTQTTVLAGQIVCHLLFALVFDSERCRLHGFVSVGLSVRLLDRLSSRHRSFQTDLGTRVDVVNERIREAGRRYKVGPSCLLLSLVVVFVSFFRMSIVDIFKGDMKGQVAKASLQMHVGFLVFVTALGACDSRSRICERKFL